MMHLKNKNVAFRVEISNLPADFLAEDDMNKDLLRSIFSKFGTVAGGGSFANRTFLTDLIIGTECIVLPTLKVF